MNRFILLTMLLTAVHAQADDSIFAVACDKAITPMIVDRMYFDNGKIHVEGRTITTQLSSFPVPKLRYRRSRMLEDEVRYFEVGIRDVSGKVNYLWSPEQEKELDSAGQRVGDFDRKKTVTDKLFDLFKSEQEVHPDRKTFDALYAQKEKAIKSFDDLYTSSFLEFERAEGCQAIAVNVTIKEQIQLTCAAASIAPLNFYSALPEAGQQAFDIVNRKAGNLYKSLSQPVRLGLTTACDLKAKIGQDL